MKNESADVARLSLLRACLRWRMIRRRCSASRWWHRSGLCGSAAPFNQLSHFVYLGRKSDNAPNLDKGRPAAFEAKTGSGHVLITFKREKP
jgi:hypothetical protein